MLPHHWLNKSCDAIAFFGDIVFQITILVGVQTLVWKGEPGVQDLSWLSLPR